MARRGGSVFETFPDCNPKDWSQVDWRTASREELIRGHFGLVYKEAYARSRRSPHRYADLFQAGCAGLCRAAQKFDPTRGVAFPTYATWWIRNGVFNELSGNSLVAVPKPCYWALMKGRRVPAAYRQSDAERALFGTRHDGEEGTSVLGGIAVAEAGPEAIERLDAEAVTTVLMKRLTAREQFVIHREFWEGATYVRIAKEMKVTRERVRQISTLALTKMKRAAVKLRLEV